MNDPSQPLSIIAFRDRITMVGEPNELFSLTLAIIDQLATMTGTHPEKVLEIFWKFLLKAKAPKGAVEVLSLDYARQRKAGGYLKSANSAGKSED